MSLLEQQDGVSLQAHGASWEIPRTRAAGPDAGNGVGCSQNTRSSRARGLGAGWHFCKCRRGPGLLSEPTGTPQFSVAAGCRQDGGTWQDGGFALRPG